MPLDFEHDLGLQRGLLEDLGYALFAVDLRGVIVHWSPAATRITGLRGVEVCGKPSATLDTQGGCFAALTIWLAAGQAPARPEPEARPIAEQPQVRATLPIRGALRGRSNRSIAVQGVARLLRDGCGVVIGAIGAVKDQGARVGDDGSRRADAIAGMIGLSDAMQEVVRRVHLAANSDVTTLVLGESGTGKELVARAVHNLSERRHAPFVAVHCAALPDAMLESELFGHQKGAFTGASQDRAGLIESAQGGTLFLDEIGDLSTATQVKLLRVLQERQVRRLGGTETIPIDVRLVTATNRDLRQLLAHGSMREDFYYRIKVYEITLPPLRERLADVAPLLSWFAQKHAGAHGAAPRTFSEAAMRRLLEHAWPGNVRELRNVVEHAMVTAEGDCVELCDLPDDVRRPGGVARGAIRAAEPEQRLAAGWSPRELEERLQVLAELDRNDWNRTETAVALGYSRVTLWKKMRKFGIDEGVFRRGG